MEQRIVQIGVFEFAVESETRHGKVRGKRSIGGFASAREAQAWIDAHLSRPEPDETVHRPAAVAANC